MDEENKTITTNGELILTKEEASILAKELKQRLEDGKKPEDDINQIKKLIAGLGDTRGLLRRTFSEGLGVIGKKALPELRNALINSENVVVRRAAAKTLKLVGDPRALPDLLNALLKDNDPVVQGSSAGAMAIFGEEAVNYLLEVLKNPLSSSLQCGLAAWGLAFVGSKGAKALKKAAKSESPQIRASAIAALGEQIQTFNDKEAKDIVKDGLQDCSDEVQIEAIKLTHLLKKNELELQVINDKLKNKNPEIRKQVIFSLMKMNAIQSKDTLSILLLTEEDKSVASVIRLAINDFNKDES